MEDWVVGMYYILYVSVPYLTTLPILARFSHKSVHKRGGAYANFAHKWVFLVLLGAFPGGPGGGAKKLGKYASLYS